MSEFESGTSQLLCELTDKVLVITLNRPDARNALSDELTGAMRRALSWAETAPEVGAVLITGAGKAFCAGGDVKRMGDRNSSPPPAAEVQFQEMRSRHHELAGALTRMRKPSVAALPGAAAGAGLALALACDMRVCAERAFVTTGYAQIGLSGDYGIAWLLTRVVGPGRARELMLTSSRVSSLRAEQLGLVNVVVADDELMTSALDLARNLANGPQAAYAYMKDNLDEALTIDHATAIDREADRLMKTRSTADHREAVTAFAEKRPPVFKGE